VYIVEGPYTAWALSASKKKTLKAAMHAIKVKVKFWPILLVTDRENVISISSPLVN
jgi:hypothetical protein